VARLLATVDGLADRPIRVALAAPTGRAAARLEEAVNAELTRLGQKGFAGPGPFTSSTVHRLLGSRPGSTTRFWHDRRNHLPHDVVVVDEASMMSLTLVARLLEALRPDCRLVMVGDPDQLVSVEAGAVLGDIVHRSPRPEPDARLGTLRDLFASDLQPRDEVESDLCADVVRLRRNFRFGGAAGLNDLAEAVRSGEADAALAVLQAGDTSLEFVDVDAAQALASSIAGLRDDAVRAARRLVAAAEVGDVAGALDALAHHRLLCAHREGPYGISYWRHLARLWLVEAIPEYGRGGEFYVGRPLLVTANDYEVGLFNGDIGAVIMRDGQAVAAFGHEGPFVATSRLSDVQTPHAMTVHKAQGSEADRVTVILPSADSRLLTRELLYTAITRARSFVRVIGTQDAVRAAVTRPVVRASGLRES
jgi:exodeoxyribonuclease V alpha subunit